MWLMSIRYANRHVQTCSEDPRVHRGPSPCLSKTSLIGSPEDRPPPCVDLTTISMHLPDIHNTVRSRYH
ncbi:hypothetical protein CgunFtcFv8_013654 [Champsocephalus gunnari]|uniref:Uncharacterized protein n=1 Tax=Champsocephalus gunnari TaxID=52237 RepID=A0AAN8DSV5_CHAGU|nr:hypothetical protein CgunFtcFv8_013654 [Champsocephalus gunnari]